MKQRILFALLIMLVAGNAAEFDWSRAVELHPGIRRLTATRNQPRLMKINAVRIDLATPRLAVVTTGRDREWGRPMPDFPKGTVRTRRQTTRDFLTELRDRRNFDARLGVNASPWTPWQRPFTHRYADQLGLVIADGVVVSPLNPRRPAFVVRKNNQAEFRTFTAADKLDDIQVAVSGFAWILQNRRVLPGSARPEPRTGYGLSADRRYFYIVTVDGRQPGYSMGAATPELAQILLDCGSADALNMDGGGSTTLINVETPGDGKYRLLRLNRAAGERRNGNNLAFGFR